MRHLHDTAEQASASEALQAVVAGLTPLKVQTAILAQRRAETASQHGFERNAITRLALRWGILEA